MLEIETDSLHLALAEENIFDCIQPDERAAWEKCGKNQYKGFNKRDLKYSGDGLMSQYKRVIDEAVNLTSTNRDFRAVNHMVASMNKQRKVLVISKKTSSR